MRVARLTTRALAIGVLVLGWLKLDLTDPILFATWLGAAVGFVTNVVVTLCLLIIFVPLLKNRIARRMSEFASDATRLDEIPDKVGLLTGAIGLVSGLLVPVSIIPRVLIGIVAAAVSGSVGEKKAEKKLKKLKADMVHEIESMKRHQIALTMDKIIGPLFVIMEMMGAVLGAIAGGVAGYVF